jgi:hypothetical protein
LYSTCPKCGHKGPPGSAPAEACPACGIVFAKWLRRQLGATPASPPNTRAAKAEMGDEGAGLLARVLACAFRVEDRVNPFNFAGRAVAYAVMLAWGAWFISLNFEIEPYSFNNSFMHSINLVFHEAGHVFFRPFGRFMTILGGTLGQLIMPAIVMGVFLFKSNPFGASVALWWLGQSFMDCAPYIDDALVQQMVLVGGHTGTDRPGSHDWNNILGEFNALERAREFATRADTAGTLIMLAALAWGGMLLWRQFRRVDW